MSNNVKNSFQTNEIFEDYAVSSVPKEKRITWFSQGLVWAGVAFSTAIFSVGGTLAASMVPATFVTAVLSGTVIVTVVAILIGAIGAKTHLTSAFNARFALGVEGGTFFGLILALSLSGWFGYQCCYFANSTVSTLRMFGFSGGSSFIWTIAGGLLMMATVLAGFNGLTLLSTLGVPLLFALALLPAAITAGQADLSALPLVPAAGSMGLSGGVVLVVGSYITGACITPDLSRFSKRPRDAVCGCILGFMIAFPLLLLLGGFFYYVCGTSDLCDVLVNRCGFGLFIPFVLLVSIWTTNNFNLYCSVLGISNVLDGHFKIPRWLLTVTVGAASTLLGALGIMEALVSFLNLLGTLIPPVAAVIIADYYLYNRNSGLYDYKSAGKLQKFRANTCLSALVGMAMGLLCNYSNIGFLLALCSIIPSCIVSMLASVAALAICNMVTHSGTVMTT